MLGPIELVILLLVIVLPIAVVGFFGARLLRNASERSSSRECPRCGVFVKRGETVCPNCEHDFAATIH